MIEKQLQDDGTVAVTFRLEHPTDDASVCLVGDFNDWSQSSTPMQATDGTFAVTVPLEAGRSYRFRYFLGGDRWENDWAADAYVPNDHGGDDSVVDLTDIVVPVPDAAPAPAKKKAAAAKKPAAKKAAAPKKAAAAATGDEAPKAPRKKATKKAE